MAESTARVRELGRELRRVREGRSYTGHEMAIRLGWSESKVSRLETGKRSISEVEVAIYLASCGAGGELMDRLLELARNVDDGYRVQPHGEKLPDELRSLIVNETCAERIDSFEITLVPGLVQTEDYARALFRETGLVAAEGVELRVLARMERQALLRRREPPQCYFFIHEDALRGVVGSAAIMHEQMLHLVFLTSRPQCVIRVVPREAGSRGRSNGSFVVISDDERNRLAVVETEFATMFLDDPAVVRGYWAILRRLSEVALNEGQSREFLAALASEYERVK